MHIGEGISGAIFSTDRRYRYALWRVWDREKPALLFIGFNPSRADEIHDDRTVSKLAWDAKYLKYGGLYIGNLFALVETTPAECLINPEVAIGEENDKYLLELKRVAGAIVAGWGNFAEYSERYKKVIGLLGSPLYCFAITQKGQPAHPLYLLANELREYLPAPVFKG